MHDDGSPIAQRRVAVLQRLCKLQGAPQHDEHVLPLRPVEVDVEGVCARVCVGRVYVSVCARALAWRVRSA
jgi:hypothetical protein